MLKEERRPDKQKVTFTYDALGRRLSKHFSRTTTHFLWSGNETGRYISEDPIGFLSGEPNFFAYVSDTNAWVDLLGLTIGKRVKDLPKNLQRRPKWRKETKDYLYENSEKTEDGKYISAKTHKPIEPGDEIIGHQNQSWREYQEATENQNKTRKEVIDDYNDLSNLGFEDKRESSSDGGKYRGYEH